MNNFAMVSGKSISYNEKSTLEYLATFVLIIWLHSLSLGRFGLSLTCSFFITVHDEYRPAQFLAMFYVDRCTFSVARATDA